MKPMFCPRCGAVAKPKRHTKGYFVIEVLLWCCLIVPGVIYSLWRMASREWVCASCRQPGVIPPDSPMAVAQLAALGKAR